MASVALAHSLEGRVGAPVLVLGSSLGTTRRMWDPQAGALRDHFRLLRYDHRGHGASPVPPGPYSVDLLGGDLLTLLDALELERVSYCGLSLGGMVGMWLAANAPARLDRLALCCTSARLGPPRMWTDRAAQARGGDMEGVASSVVTRWFTPGFREREPAVVARARDQLVHTPPEGYAGCCEAIATMDLTESLGLIAAPTLVAAGSEDAATPVAHATVIASRIPGARLAVVAGAAHLANVERPAEVTRLLIEHLVAG